MDESSSDLESRLLDNEGPSAAREGGVEDSDGGVFSSSSRRPNENDSFRTQTSGTSSLDDQEQKRKVGPAKSLKRGHSGIVSVPSGRWQFKYQKYYGNDSANPEADDVPRGLESGRSGPVTAPSGRWQFKYQKYLENDFANPEADDVSGCVREYNKKQQEILKVFQEIDNNAYGSKGTAGTEKEDAAVKRAINWSNVMNVVLLIVKIFASYKTGSLAIVASTLDSLLDLLAGLVLMFAHHYAQRTNSYRDKYPIGGGRIQPVGIVVFAATMAAVGLQVLLTGVEQLFSGTKESMDDEQRIWLIAIMGSATVIKLVLYVYCKSFKDEIVNVYAMDHFFDVITNLVGLAAALLAEYFYWWIDPVGAIFLALYTIINWGKTVLENALSLVGETAPPQFLQKVTYMALRHDAGIEKIDTVRAYTIGSLYFVEVDIQLPGDMPLKDAHEIGETLQNKLESLEEVERAFVHLDYECTHRPEH